MTQADENEKARPPVRRVITVFDSATEALVAELPLVGFDFLKFKDWFHRGVPDDDEFMVACYEVKPGDVGFLSEYLAEQHEFDFSKYVYFVEAYVNTEDWVRYYGTVGR